MRILTEMDAYDIELEVWSAWYLEAPGVQTDFGSDLPWPPDMIMNVRFNSKHVQSRVVSHYSSLNQILEWEKMEWDRERDTENKNERDRDGDR